MRQVDFVDARIYAATFLVVFALAFSMTMSRDGIGAGYYLIGAIIMGLVTVDSVVRLILPRVYALRNPEEVAAAKTLVDERVNVYYSLASTLTPTEVLRMHREGTMVETAMALSA